MGREDQKRCVLLAVLESGWFGTTSGRVRHHTNFEADDVAQLLEELEREGKVKRSGYFYSDPAAKPPGK